MSDARPTAKLREHPRAALVPAMSEAEFSAFALDVAKHGVLQPLDITSEGVVLDGRHRLRAASQAGLPTVPVRVVAEDDPVGYMLRAALQRRHLSASQKAALALELELWQQERERADQRRRANLKQHTEVATLPPRGARTRELAASVAGCSPRTQQDVITVHAHDPQLYERVKAGEIPAHTARLELQRRQRYEAIGAAPPLPAGSFELIYADPPWQTSNPGSDYAPEQYYPTMPLDELKELPVPAADDALLYLWVIHAQLPEGLELLDAWGFVYRGDEVWVKDRIGQGVWSRYRHEQLLIGRRGTASPPAPKLRLDSVIEAPKGRHSAKPISVYERLEHLYPHLSKLELFARGTPRPGWTAWGNQVEEPT